MTPEERYKLKQKAENKYAQAKLYLTGIDDLMFWNQKGAQMDEVEKLGTEAIRLYERLNIQTLEDAVPTRMEVKGIYLPEIMHENVVRQRLNLK